MAATFSRYRAVNGDPQTLEERAFDLEHAKRFFEESNQRLRAKLDE
jgi:hypothetical protein